MRCNHENRPECLQDRYASTVFPFIPPDDVWHMERCVHHVEKQPLSRALQKWQKQKLHRIDLQKEQHQDQDDIDKVNIYFININSIIFHNECSVFTLNLNTSSCQAILVVPKKVSAGSDGNIMPFHIVKKVNLRSTKEQLAAMKNKNIKVRTYNNNKIWQKYSKNRKQ